MVLKLHNNEFKFEKCTGCEIHGLNLCKMCRFERCLDNGMQINLVSLPQKRKMEQSSQSANNFEAVPNQHLSFAPNQNVEPTGAAQNQHDFQIKLEASSDMEPISKKLKSGSVINSSMNTSVLNHLENLNM